MKPPLFTLLFSVLAFNAVNAQLEINEPWLRSLNRPRAIEQVGGFVNPPESLVQALKAGGTNVQWNINSNGLGPVWRDQLNYQPYDLKNSPYASEFPENSIAIAFFANNPDSASIWVLNLQGQSMPIIGYIDLPQDLAFRQTNAYWPKVPMQLGEQEDLDVTLAKDPNIDYEIFEYKQSLQYDGFGNLTFDNVNYPNCVRTVLKVTKHIKGLHKITKRKIEEKEEGFQYRWYTDHFFPVAVFNESSTIRRSPDGGFPLYDTTRIYTLDHNIERFPLAAKKTSSNHFALSNNLGEGPLALNVNATTWNRASWQIIDLAGKITHQGVLMLVPGAQQWSIPTDQLVPGLYHLVIKESAADPVAFKFVR